MPWRLESAEDAAAAAPRSFFIPPAEIRRGLKVGDFVKLIFRLEREDGEVAVERMWVEVVQTGPLAGTLANDPRLTGVVAHGDRVEFGPEHVAAYEYSVEQLGYPPGEHCHVSPAIVRDDIPPEFLYLDRDGRWWALAGPERPERTWQLGHLTDHFPEAAAPLREAYAADEPPRDARWRREGDGYVRWNG